jgi:thioredoxin reductase (NADPH)
LAAAIAASRRGLRYLVLERGALVNSLLHFPPDMVFFTTPELLEIGGMPFVSPYEKPTRREALQYYRKVTDACGLEIALNEPVVGLVRRSSGEFVVTSQPAHQPAVERVARAVVLATGAYDLPNLLEVPGEDLPHVSHYYHGAHQYYRQRVVVVGGKNSAAEAALDLYRTGAQVLLVHRRPSLGESIKYWVKPDIENRVKEGSIRARLSTRLTAITPTTVELEGPEGLVSEPADAVLLLTGYRSDVTLLRMAGAEDIDGAPVHNPETFESTVPNLFVAGAGVAGRESGRIFIENGRFHGEVVIREIASRSGSGVSAPSSSSGSYSPSGRTARA